MEEHHGRFVDWQHRDRHQRSGIKEFLTRYGFLPFDGIRHIPGEGSRPAVMVNFEGLGPEMLRRLQARVHNMFWKNRKISVRV